MQSFWKNRKVLVTGASGFIGSHLSLQLIELGAELTVLMAKPVSKNSLLYASKQSIQAQKIIGNIADYSFIKSFFSRNKFSICFHLAAQALLDSADSDPIETFETNIQGTWNILNAARFNKLDGLIIASTAHVYGNNKVPFKEEYFPRPSGPYETSKACADMLAQTYANYYSLPVAIARFVNIYGPGDQNNRIVPKTIKNLLNKKSPEIYSDNTTRDYMYVDDAINAYIILAERIKKLKIKKTDIIFNFGTGKHFSNAEIIRKISVLIDTYSSKPVVLNKRKLEVDEQYVSIEKATRYLNWKPKYSIDEGLLKTIEWYRNN